TRFDELPSFLLAGDLLVVNTSATLPAALSARRRDGTRLELRLSTPSPGQPGDHWVVELRLGDSPFREARAGDELELPAGGQADILAPPRTLSPHRLCLARLLLPEPLERYLERQGRPIRYRYVPQPWPLEAYQTVYALEPGSAEMPSGGRPLSPELLTRLAASGILAAPSTPHARVS